MKRKRGSTKKAPKKKPKSTTDQWFAETKKERAKFLSLENKTKQIKLMFSDLEKKKEASREALAKYLIDDMTEYVSSLPPYTEPLLKPQLDLDLDACVISDETWESALMESKARLVLVQSWDGKSEFPWEHFNDDGSIGREDCFSRESIEPWIKERNGVQGCCEELQKRFDSLQCQETWMTCLRACPIFTTEWVVSLSSIRASLSVTARQGITEFHSMTASGMLVWTSRRTITEELILDMTPASVLNLEEDELLHASAWHLTMHNVMIKVKNAWTQLLLLYLPDVLAALVIEYLVHSVRK